MRFFKNIAYCICVLFIGFKCEHGYKSYVEHPHKINGLSVASGPDDFDTLDVHNWQKLNAKWVCFMPFGFVDTKTGKVLYNQSQQWKGESFEGIYKSIKLAKQNGFHIMLKPQLWCGFKAYTGHVDFEETSTQWKNFEQEYTAYIKTFHALADSTGCDLFVLGTELNTMVMHHKAYWLNLIAQLREQKIKLTYAENWDVFDKVYFWDKLDYIGVNAYFPVSKHKTCSPEELYPSWQNILSDLESISAKNNKPILFTEYGYRSTNYCGKEPWNYSHDYEINNNNQQLCLKALFDNCWNKTWFAGGFLWKMYGNKHPIETNPNKDFTVVGKPAELLIQKAYKQN